MSTDDLADTRAAAVANAIAAQKTLKAHRAVVCFEVSRRTRFLVRFAEQVKANPANDVSDFLTPQIAGWLSNPTLGI
jgi:hypothetical protein